MKPNKSVFDNNTLDIKLFLEASKEYLETGDNIPVLAASSSVKFSHDVSTVHIYFYDDLLKQIVKYIKKYSRDLRSLITYGYRGNSRGGKNGLVNIPERDKNLQEIVENFQSSCRYTEFCERIGILDGYKELFPVKVVTHRKSGERIVGVLDKSTWNSVLYDVKSYKK